MILTTDGKVEEKEGKAKTERERRKYGVLRGNIEGEINASKRKE